MNNFTKSAALSFALMFSAHGALATPASLDTPESIAAAMQACVAITAGHSYDADGQTVEIDWNRITERSASFGAQNAQVNLSANVWGNENTGNSFCDFLFTEQSLAEAAFDQFTRNSVAVVHEGKSGVCAGDQFVRVEMTGPDGPLAKPMRKQGHITVHNGRVSGINPCAD